MGCGCTATSTKSLGSIAIRNITYDGCGNKKDHCIQSVNGPLIKYRTSAGYATNTEQLLYQRDQNALADCSVELRYEKGDPFP